MKQDRSSIPVDPADASALGLAVYCFASLEWNAVLACERLEPGSMESLEDRTRNNVVDAKPGSTPYGAQRLLGHCDPWTLAKLEAGADAFAACSARLGTALIALRSRDDNNSRGADLQRGPGA